MSYSCVHKHIYPRPSKKWSTTPLGVATPRLKTTDIDYEEWWQHTPLSESNTNGKPLWFNSTHTDTNFWAEILWLDGQWQAAVNTVPLQRFQKLSTRNLILHFLEVDKTCVNVFGILPRFLENLVFINQWVTDDQRISASGLLLQISVFEKVFTTQCTVTAGTIRYHLRKHNHVGQSHTIPCPSIVPDVCIQISQKDSGFVRFNPSQDITSFFHDFHALEFGTYICVKPQYARPSVKWDRFLNTTCQLRTYKYCHPGVCCMRSHAATITWKGEAMYCAIRLHDVSFPILPQIPRRYEKIRIESFSLISSKSFNL